MTLVLTMRNSDHKRPMFVESDSETELADSGTERISKNGQVLVEKTRMPSTSHPYAKIWKARCGACGLTYGVNSCDFHIRRCPSCQGGEPGEPTDLPGLEDRPHEDSPEGDIKEPPVTGVSKVVQHSPQIGKIKAPPAPRTTQPDTSNVIRSVSRVAPAPAVPRERNAPPSSARRWLLSFIVGAIIGLIVLAGIAYYLNQQPEIDLVDGAGVLKGCSCWRGNVTWHNAA